MLLNWWLNFGPSLRKIPSWKISSACRWCYQRAVAHLFWMCFAIATLPNKMKRPEHVICILLMFCKLLKISTKCMQAKYIHVIQKNHHRIIHQFVFSVMMAREGHKVLYYHCHMERNYKNYLWGNEENFRRRFSYNSICSYLCLSHSWQTRHSNEEFSSIQTRSVWDFFVSCLRNLIIPFLHY